MNYQPKVSTAQKYSDSQGEHIVCKGRLVSVIDREEQLKRDSNSLGLGESLGKATAYKNYIISETEPLKFGDWVYNSKSKEIYQIPDEPFVEYEHKILALPEHFSDKHLQAIADGKLKDGDEVILKCERMMKYEDGSESLCNSPIDVYDGDFKRTHLNQQNYITFFPVKQSLEEAVKIYSAPYNEGYQSIEDAFKAGAEWAKKNNY